MKTPTLMRQSRIAVEDVVVRDRLRPVSPAGVEALRASIAEVGVMKDAIHVRKLRDGELRLLAGAHRLAAAVEMGWEEIEAKVWTDVTDDWARLIEIDDNLAGAEMNALDTAVFLATRKAVYERLRPDTRADAFKGNRHTGSLVSDTMSFARSAAEKFGLSRRQVERMVSAGSRLGADEVARLRQAPRPVTLKDLQDLAKVNNAPDRYDVVAALAEGRAKSASAALKALKAPVEAPPKDAVEEQFIALVKVWARAGQRAKRRFVAEYFEELGLLGADEEEARFEAEKPALLAEVVAMRGRG